MLGDTGRIWSSEGCWRRRHVINAGSFIFVPVIEWESRACILMPINEDKPVLKPSHSTLKALEAESRTPKPAERTESEGEGEENAVFGTEIWPAAEYGLTMHTIRQRIGPLLMKMQKRYVYSLLSTPFRNMDYTGEMTEKEIIVAERNSGVISNRVREIC
ncbi:hypothetical protein SADUNF_Sadunf01G0002500 [Salix dunnii]|uniref:Uncharacterized protein n=1 Tax=Salix dunnii TaxID=1413687 RepID=A0A835TJ96_9ROSI|nr:hypothetical protein SADUNF_Sadunf01G0002500 [Salix dunnii]